MGATHTNVLSPKKETSQREEEPSGGRKKPSLAEAAEKESTGKVIATGRLLLQQTDGVRTRGAWNGFARANSLLQNDGFRKLNPSHKCMLFFRVFFFSWFRGLI